MSDEILDQQQYVERLDEQQAYQLHLETQVAELEAKLVKRLAKYMAALDLINDLEAQLVELQTKLAKDSSFYTHFIIANAQTVEAEAQLAEFQKLVDETKEGELAFTPEDLQAILEKE